MSEIVGVKIKDVRPATSEELAREGWDNETLQVIELENGNILYPSRDYEGNGPGAIFGFVDNKTIAF